MVVLTKKSKLFIKAKLTVSKSCLLGPACFMICCILGVSRLQNLSFLRRLSTKSIFFQLFWHFHISPEALEAKLEIAYFFNITFPRIAIVEVLYVSGGQLVLEIWLKTSNNFLDFRIFLQFCKNAKSTKLIIF